MPCDGLLVSRRQIGGGTGCRGGYRRAPRAPTGEPQGQADWPHHLRFEYRCGALCRIARARPPELTDAAPRRRDSISHRRPAGGNACNAPFVARVLLPFVLTLLYTSF